MFFKEKFSLRNWTNWAKNQVVKVYPGGSLPGGKGEQGACYTRF